jgi:hypothetical protein
MERWRRSKGKKSEASSVKRREENARNDEN